MRVFVTGGTGFIGQCVVNGLQVRGYDVTVLVRDPASPAARALAAAGAELAVGDVTDRAALRAGMAGAEAVIHNAGIYAFGLTRAERRQMTAVNVNGTANTLGIAHELGIRRILYVSTAFAFGETDGHLRDETWVRRSTPQSHYEATKTEAHELALGLQRAGAPIVVLCPVAVAGPGDHSSLGHMARLYVRGQMPPFSFGNGTVSFVHVDDVAAAITHAVERGREGETYLLSGGALPLREVFKTWHTMPGAAEYILWYLPRWLAVRLCAIAQPFQRLFRLPRVFSADLARSAFMDLRFSGAKAMDHLEVNFRPPRQVWRDTLKVERNRWLA